MTDTLATHNGEEETDTRAETEGEDATLLGVAAGWLERQLSSNRQP
jgi:hypothetical protein